MQETSRHAVGIDIGTTTVRCVVAHIDGATGVPTIVGVGVAPNSGMRKGTVVNYSAPTGGASRLQHRMRNPRFPQNAQGLFRSFDELCRYILSRAVYDLRLSG